MQKINFEDELEKIVARDARYDQDAYLFLREALDHTQKIQGKSDHSQVNHVSGQQLLEGIRDYALKQFGPMTPTVFEEWGIKRCEDFGEIVFNMVEQGLLSKTDRDTRQDFQSGYDFYKVFKEPFLPASRRKSSPHSSRSSN